MANRYWVGNGGSWLDTAHWSATTGGASGASVPDYTNDVIFDANSFTTTGQQVIVNTTGVSDSTVSQCRTMTWTGVLHSPDLATGTGTQTLSIGYQGTGTTTYLTLDPNMTVSFTGTIGVGWSLIHNGIANAIGTVQIDTAGISMGCSLGFNGRNISSPGQTTNVTLLSNIDIDGQFSISWGDYALGTLTTNNYTISCGQFTVFMTSANVYTTVVNLGTSTITTETFNLDVTTVNGSTSNIILPGVGTGSFTIGAFSNTGSLQSVSISGICSPFYTNHKLTIDTLTFNAGATIKMYGSDITDVNNLIAHGILGNLVTIQGHGWGGSGQSTLNAIVSTSLINVDVKDSLASGIINFIDIDGINSGNNTNWTFPPVANFTASPLSGSSPLQVFFTDTSTENPTSWLWNFSIASSTSQNPDYTFINGGTYTIQLIATNAAGSDTETKIAYLTVTNPDQSLQIVELVGSDLTGDVQTLNVGKSDDSEPIYYELETQELEFANRALYKRIMDKLGVAALHASDSKIQFKLDEQDYKDILIGLSKRVNIATIPVCKAHYLTVRWSGSSTTKSAILEGFYLTNVKEEGILYG